MVITPNQMREARLALGWSRQRLAGISNTTANFVKIYEEEGRVARINLRQFAFKGLDAIEALFVEHGIHFDHLNDEAHLRPAHRPGASVTAADERGHFS